MVLRQQRRRPGGMRRSCAARDCTRFDADMSRQTVKSSLLTAGTAQMTEPLRTTIPGLLQIDAAERLHELADAFAFLTPERVQLAARAGGDFHAERLELLCELRLLDRLHAFGIDLLQNRR